jgi:hypothetical protein
MSQVHENKNKKWTWIYPNLVDMLQRTEKLDDFIITKSDYINLYHLDLFPHLQGQACGF